MSGKPFRIRRARNLPGWWIELRGNLWRYRLTLDDAMDEVMRKLKPRKRKMR